MKMCPIKKVAKEADTGKYLVKTVFTLKYVYIGAAFTIFLFLIATLSFLTGSPKNQVFGTFVSILGTASFTITLKDLCARINGRHDTLRSSELEKMQEDFTNADIFMEGKIYVGETYLFSIYAGRIIRCEHVSGLRERVFDHVRGSSTATLTANVSGEGQIDLAKYYYGRGRNQNEFERLKQTLRNRRN